jgi:hypothetical protein
MYECDAEFGMTSQRFVMNAGISGGASNAEARGHMEEINVHEPLLLLRVGYSVICGYVSYESDLIGGLSSMQSLINSPRVWASTLPPGWESHREERHCDACEACCSRAAVSLGTALLAEGESSLSPGAQPLDKAIIKSISKEKISLIIERNYSDVRDCSNVRTKSSGKHVCAEKLFFCLEGF